MYETERGINFHKQTLKRNNLIAKSPVNVFFKLFELRPNDTLWSYYIV